MCGKCVLRAQKKKYKNTLGSRNLLTGFDLVTILTPPRKHSILKTVN